MPIKYGLYKLLRVQWFIKDKYRGTPATMPKVNQQMIKSFSFWWAVQ